MRLGQKAPSRFSFDTIGAVGASLGQMSLRSACEPLPDWDALYREHGRAVRLRLLGRRVPYAVVNDLVHEVWETLIENVQRGVLTTIEMPGLALAEADHAATRYFRCPARRRETSSDALELGAGPARGSVAEAQLQLQEVARVVAQSSDIEREVFQRLYGVHPQSVARAAHDLNKRPQYIRQICCTLRRRLRELLQ